MSFLAPLMLAFAVALPVIVALYLLKLKRQRVEVPSTLLWLKSIQDMTANAPFQRLRNNLLLWLQLLIALLAVLALARPFLAMDQTRNQTVLLLLDNSASMQSTDTGGQGFATRLDQAKAYAREIIDNLGPDDVMLPATFSSRTQTLVSSPTGDRHTLRAAIDGIQATDRPTDIRDALALVRSLVDHVSNPEIAVISDGALGDNTGELIAMANNPEGPHVRYLRCGTRGENTGLTAFSLNRAIEDQAKVEIYAEAENTSSRPVETTLELWLDDTRLDVKPLVLEPGQTRGAVFSNIGDAAGVLRVQISADDDLAADNVAYGVLSPQRDLRVLLVSGRENRYMREALGRQDALELSVAAPGAYSPVEASQSYDLIILDGLCPPNLPDGNYLIFGAPLTIEGFTARPQPIGMPPVVDWDRTSPLTRFADFGLITVRQAIDFTPPAYAEALVSTNRGPLICLIERGPMSIIYGGFDLYQSDWPFLVSFPVFITNTVQHFRARVGSSGQFTVPTGEALAIPVRRDTQGLRLRAPGGQTTPLEYAPGTPVYYYTNTDRAGLYEVTETGGANRTLRYAASLLSYQESRTTPSDQIGEGEQALTGETQVVRANTEVWRWLAWGALIILCIEWFIYLRRTWL
jgi:Ca-activated chloride channel homolog